MRCLMLAALVYVMGLLVLALSLVAMPLEQCGRALNRLQDWAEIRYWLALAERKTRGRVKRRWRGN